MLRLIVPLAIEEIFANAGMSVVERSLIRALLETGCVQLRLLAHGDEEQQARLAEACRSLNAGTLLEIVPFTPVHGLEVLDGMDGMMLHGLPPAFFEWLLTNRITSRLPVVQHIHSLYLIDFEIQAFSSLWTGWNNRPPARWVAPSLCTARRARSLTVQLAGEVTFPQVSVIPHGVFIEEHRGNRHRGREILGAQDQEIVVLSLNRLSPEKCDYYQLVRAFHELEKSAPRVALRLALVGGLAPDDVDYVRRIHVLLDELGLSQKAIIIVHLDERDKPDVLAGADLFVSLACNPQESFGVALLEAQAAGLPLIATDWNGYKEVVLPFYHDKLVPTLASNEYAQEEANWRLLSEACAPDFCALLELMRRFIADPDLRREAAESGRRNVQTFTWADATRQLLELWAEVLNSPEDFGGAEPGFADTELWRAQSPVDPMATIYAEPDNVLDVSPHKEARLRGLELPGPLRALLTDVNRQTVTIDQWRTASSLSAGSADRLLLHAVRKGVLAIRTP